MRGNLRVGRVFGIEVRVDWSWVFIFALMSWNLTLLFARWHPAWGAVPSLLVAVTAALLFFASVLAHELAHSLVAKAYGIEVRSITLFLFGGVSNFEREPPSPRIELLSAIVGPITSVVLGIGFLLLGSLGASLGTAATDPALVLSRVGPLTTLLLWLGPVNIMVGLFNLLPGFPLDGGRVLRAALWAATKNLHTATQWAARVGQGVAWCFIAAGVAMALGLRVPVFGTGFGAGLWLAFIGWFLNTAASQSYAQMLVREMLEGVPVARVMRHGGPAVAAEIPVSTLVDEWIMGTDERAFPVVSGGAFVGLVCMEDVRRAPRDRWSQTPVAEVMTPRDKLVVTTPEADLADALGELSRRDVSQLPVVRDGAVVGMLRRRDVARWLELQSDGPRDLRWDATDGAARPRET